ncbi:DEAD/DEAH box helicase [Roseomonas sp. E05]|uniref:DEAD/DEAH box helicase n=1 Tax=Roseomonas sp. E05 TaxID=3046310 RepID=UPI0024BA3060|nr:DEAD/DEAH box helicase [Roseomonas sp. E05]MDJ0391032.1 DEAD/DEAH box helicase [Roseomonas sp. E05]
MHITDKDIRQAVSRNAFQAGLEYWSARREAAFLSPDGRLLSAKVRGSARRPYQQTVHLRRSRDGGVVISGTCTCPIGFNCKHVAAALFACREQPSAGAEDAVEAERARGSLSPFPGMARPASASLWPPGSGQHSAVPAGSVSPAIAAWLNRVEAAGEEESEDYPPAIRRRLLYVLRPEPGLGGLGVELVSTELKRDGTLSGRTKHYTPSQLLHPAQQPRFLRPSDRRIIRRLAALGSTGESGEEFIETLRRILATGRGRWGRHDGPVLCEGPSVAAQLAWCMSESGAQHLDLGLPAGLQALRLAAPWYLDTAASRIGPVQLDLPPRLAHALLAAPPLPPEAARHVQAELARRLPDRPLPSPQELPPPQDLQAPPVPHLCLTSGELPFDPHAPLRHSGLLGRVTPAPVRLPLAHLSFQYGPVRLPDASGAASTVLQDGQLYRVIRDRAAEAAAARRLQELEFDRLGSLILSLSRHAQADAWLPLDPDPGVWIDVMLHEVPALRAAGWTIEVAEDFPLQLAEASGDVIAEVHEGSGIDWFDIGLGVMVDGERVDLLPALLDLLCEAGPDASRLTESPAEGEGDTPFLLPLADGRLLAMPGARLREFLAVLLELFAGRDVELADGRLRLPRAHAADLALLETASAASGVVWQGGEALRALGRQLRDTGGIPPAVLPDGFTAVLRPYQARGVDWLQFLRATGLGGVLADDMGLGKTVQALAHIAIEQAAGRLDRPALVVCPTSLVANWQAEAARFAPGLRVLALHGRERGRHFDRIGAHDLVLTTYPLLTRDHAALTAQDWHVVVLDEAQTIKNPQAGTTKLAGRLRARQRLCLSGTPLENHLGELWSLFDFLMPGFLGDRQGFGRLWRAPIERGGDTARQAVLARRVAPFLLRRTKAEVAADLPPRMEIVEATTMEAGQRAVYESIRLAMHARVRQAIAERGLARSGIIILDALLKLRQACCDPRLLKLTTAKATRARSAKLERLMEMLPALLQEGRRILLFSQFTTMLALIETELDRARMPYVKLTGQTRDRTTPVRRFQAGEVPLFLVSLKAGGVGLNLTAADTVIHYDPWWNPAVEDQATDRAHRIGQERTVFAHRLITEDTIERKMEMLKARKQAIVAGILGAGPGVTLDVTEADLEALFAPVDP